MLIKIVIIKTFTRVDTLYNVGHHNKIPDEKLTTHFARKESLTGYLLRMLNRGDDTTSAELYRISDSLTPRALFRSFLLSSNSQWIRLFVLAYVIYVVRGRIEFGIQNTAKKISYVRKKYLNQTRGDLVIFYSRFSYELNLKQLKPLMFF